MEMSKEDLKFVTALCKWMEEMIDDEDIADIKKEAEEFRRDYEKKKYLDILKKVGSN